MSNQYLLRLRKAHLNFKEEGYTKLINTRLLSEGGASVYRFSSISIPTALVMEETQHSTQGDVSGWDDEEGLKLLAGGKSADHAEIGGRVRLYSESQVHTVSRWEDSEVQDEESGGADGAPFRGRSQSAPAVLWKAEKYGRQLRRMSDEFDTWLDKGEMRRVSSSGRVMQTQNSRGWFSFLWGTNVEEGRE